MGFYIEQYIITLHSY